MWTSYERWVTYVLKEGWRETDVQMWDVTLQVRKDLQVFFCGLKVSLHQTAVQLRGNLRETNEIRRAQINQQLRGETCRTNQMNPNKVKVEIQLSIFQELLGVLVGGNWTLIILMFLLSAQRFLQVRSWKYQAFNL